MTRRKPIIKISVLRARKAAAHERALQLAQLARNAGDKPLARKLLSNFDGRYPNDPLQSVAAKLSLDLQR